MAGPALCFGCRLHRRVCETLGKYASTCLCPHLVLSVHHELVEVLVIYQPVGAFVLSGIACSREEVCHEIGGPVWLLHKYGSHVQRETLSPGGEVRDCFLGVTWIPASIPGECDLSGSAGLPAVYLLAEVARQIDIFIHPNPL